MRVYPVVHINTPDVAFEQGAAALEAGADGVYLIDHLSANPEGTFSTFNRLVQERPEAFVGMNLLGYEPSFALHAMRRAVASSKLSREPDALWTDDILEGRAASRTGEAKRYRDRYEMKTRILGGVAFKYTSTYTDVPKTAARLASFLEPYVDTVTTSGHGTGKAPSYEKISAMKAVIKGDLAVASGIDVENISRYHGTVDEILAASSIETESYSGIFDQSKLHDLIEAAHDLA